MPAIRQNQPTPAPILDEIEVPISEFGDGERVDFSPKGGAATLPEIKPNFPVLLAWQGEYQCKEIDGRPVIVPTLVPHEMRPGVQLIDEHNGKADYGKIKSHLESQGHVLLVHPGLDYSRRRQVHTRDGKPRFRHYFKWQRLEKDRSGAWFVFHNDESEEIKTRFCLSLYPGGKTKDGIVPFPTDHDVETLRNRFARTLGRHIDATTIKGQAQAEWARQRLKEVDEAAKDVTALSEDGAPTREQEIAALKARLAELEV